MKKEIELAEREELVLSILWKFEEEGKTIICKDVVETLKDEYDLNLADTTVYTFLNKLEQKGYIKKERKGVNFYTTIKSKDEYLENVLRRINKMYFNGKKKKLIDKIKSMDM